MFRSALALVVVASSASAASAGGYVGLGIGTSPAVSSEIGFAEFHESGRSGRLAIGYRFGHFAVEGMASKAELVSQFGVPYAWTSFAVAGRVNFEIGDRFELFGRFGLHHSEFDLENSADDFAGSGLMGGVGVEYRFTVGGVGLAAVIDYTISHADIQNNSRAGNPEWGATSRVWTLGGIVYF